MADIIHSHNDWLIEEKEFRPEFARKYESILCQGNGYMGIRGATEETYEKTVRYGLVAGTFDKMERKNTTELPNFADVTALSLTADGVALSLTPENTAYYHRSLDMKTGLLTRSFLWSVREGVKLSFCTERFVSLSDLHVLGQRLVLESVEGDTQICLSAGIQGGQRYGDPHFGEGKATEQKGILQFTETTHESRIDFVVSADIRVWHRHSDGRRSLVPMEVKLDTESAIGTWQVSLQADEALVLEKLCRIATARDKDLEGEKRALQEQEIIRTEKLAAQGYRAAFQASKDAWAHIWENRDIRIRTVGEESTIRDQKALRFAVYHLTCMAPLHDNRMNIGAKGLSGKGYFGHTFWDTEIYMLPYFIWTDPKGARSLLEYRYRCLESARENARYYGQEGARFPWEAAWITDRETCPEDHFSKHEVHVSADVAYGVYYYYAVTRDLEFMLRYGCELLFETAQFWTSRVEYNEQKGYYEILDVIGPDEFTHEANNNAFTNYLAHLNLTLAYRWQETLLDSYPEEYERLNRMLSVADKALLWKQVADKLFLPQPDENHILPQDDDFMTLPEIDLSVYRAGEKKLRKDYPYPTYTRLKVSKQADVMNLFLLREEDFAPEVKRASLAYYEPYCVHESSLSLCAYSMLAADCGEQKTALELFQKAKAIDLGENMKSSDEGIHAASLGGIWQCCTLGFAGVRLQNEQLRILPNMPKHWKEAKLRICWRDQHLELTVEPSRVTVQVLEGSDAIEVLTEKGVLTGHKVLSWEY